MSARNRGGELQILLVIQFFMKQYHDLLKSILINGKEHHDRTGVGTISHFGYQTRFDLREGFPIVTTKKVPFRWVAEELFWFLSGETNEANLSERGVDIWAEWADEEHTKRFGREPGDLGPVYGYLWRSFGGNYPERDGVDQIAHLVDEILAQSKLTPTDRYRVGSSRSRSTSTSRPVIHCFSSR